MTVSGGGFSAGEMVMVKYETGLASPGSVPLCTASATSIGTFTCLAHLPGPATAGATGPHTITAKGLSSLTKVKSTFTLT